MDREPLDLEIEAFDRAPPRPEVGHESVVVFYSGRAQAWFKSVGEAYIWAKDRFPANHYLIRDLAEETPFLPLLVIVP